MVAFIGAVICIIFAVHGTGGGAAAAAAAAAQQPEADNHSLYTDSAAHIIPGRSSSGGARPGPLGALHGSETPGSEAPTGFLHVGGLDAAVVPGGGLTGHDPRVSRLICTPIPAAGDCNPRNLFQQQQQQADEPPSHAAHGGGGEEDAAGTGYLRTAAEELRHTVSQQKDQILTDQRTIRELTGKLTECERGLDGRGSSSSSERRPGSAAGLLRGRGGGRANSARKTISTREEEEDGVMVRDSPGAEALHLLTVRAVDELELAITQLKDRIEKLELDIGPFQLNLMDANASILPGGGGRGGGGGGGQPDIPEERSVEPVEGRGPWTLEDLEGELQKKVELLDKERKGLRLETQRHRNDIDLGIDKLHHRIAGLEDAGRPAFPEGYRLSFLSRTNYMYAVLKHPVPELRALTVCMWLRPAEGGIGTPVSYAVPAQPNELVLLQGLHTPVELLVNDKVAQLPLNLSRGSWQHICVSWSHKGGAWQAYQGGKLRGEGSNLATGHHVRPGGVLILGQEQDSPGGGFDSSQALVGELSQVALWDRVLTPIQVASLARCGRVTHGSVAPWTEKAVEVHGGATKEPGEPCSKHSRSSQ